MELLGLKIDQKLKFDVHIHKVCQKTARLKLNALHRIRKSSTLELPRILINSFVNGPVWVSTSNLDTYKQKRSAKSQ